MKLVRWGLLAALLLAPHAADAQARPPAQKSGPISLYGGINCMAAPCNIAGANFATPPSVPSINITGTGSTGPIDGMSVTPPARGLASPVSSLFDGTLTLLSFGAKDDNATDNTAAFQAAVNAASAAGRSLRISASTGGTGKFRIGNVDLKTANLEMDENVQLLNLDGSKFTGGYNAGGGNNLFDVALPGNYAYGRRIFGSFGQSMAMTKNGDREQNFLTFTGQLGTPYSVVSAMRDFSLFGQGGPTSASFASSGRFVNVYNVSNGPGFNISCTATNGSNVLTNCTPSPTGTHTATNPDGSVFSQDGGKTAYNIPNVFNPCKATAAGIPAGASVSSWDSGAIALTAAGSFTAGALYTGTTGTISVNLQCGRSEINHASWHIDTVGKTGAGGPAGGMNFYNDSFAGTNQSDNPADQEGFLSPFEFIAYKQTPGLIKDRLHNGSYGLVAVQLPVAGNKTYTMHDGAAITGWSGVPGLSGGQDANATAAAQNGLRVGGPCASVFCDASSRSWYQTGINVQDYETGMIFQNQRPTGFSGTAIYIAPGAGNIDVQDNIRVGKAVIETNPGTPASSTAACTQGQHAWDANYEYRCVAANTWKRAALATW